MIKKYSDFYINDSPFSELLYPQKRIEIDRSDLNPQKDVVTACNIIFDTIIQKLDLILIDDLIKYYGNNIEFYLKIMKQTDPLLFNGRIDMLNDVYNGLKILEFNINRPSSFSEQMIENESLLIEQLNEYFKDYNNVLLIINETIHSDLAFCQILKEYVKDCNFVIATINNIKNSKCYNTQLEDFDFIINYHPIELIDKQTLFDIYSTNKVGSSLHYYLFQNKSFLVFIHYLIDNYECFSHLIIYQHFFLKSYLMVEFNKTGIDWIVKPLNGRFSKDVMLIEDFNKNRQKYDLNKFIVQQKVNAKMYNYFHQKYLTHECMRVYIVHGVYFINKKFVQTIARADTNLITKNEICLKTNLIDYDFSVIEADNYSINEKAFINYNTSFTGFGDSSNFNRFDYLSKCSLELSSMKLNELKFISIKYVGILKKLKGIMIKNNLLSKYDDYFEYTNLDMLLARIDIVINSNNQFKILEINPETPAGLCESFLVNPYKNEKYYNQLKHNVSIRLKEINAQVIVVCRESYYEDIYNVSLMCNILDELKYEYYVCSPFDIKYVNGEALVFKKKFDVIYRYISIDEIIKEFDVIDQLLIEKKITSLVSNDSLIYHDKSSMAYLYEYLNEFNVEEQNFITKYVPYTSVNINDFSDDDFIIAKSKMGREGNNIKILKQNNALSDDYIYQKMECLYLENKTDFNYIVIGTYVSENDFCGFYVRIGDQITNKSCQNLWLKEKGE